METLIVGAGRVGERFTKALTATDSEVTIYDVSLERALSLAQRYSYKATENLADAINTSDLVYILTPISSHFEIARQAIEAGKSVFCEKPLTGDLNQALELQSLVHRYNTVFAVGNYARLNSSISAVEEYVRAGKVGKISSIRSSYLHDMTHLNRETPWRAEEGILYDGGVHPVDLACWIASEPVEEVMAMIGLKTDPTNPHPEDYRIVLTFKSGLVADIWVNAKAKVPEHGVEIQVLGSKGMITAHNKHEYITVNGLQSVVPQGSLPIDRVVKIMENRFQRRTDNCYPLPTINEAVASIRILDAVERSIAKRSIVNLAY